MTAIVDFYPTPPWAVVQLLRNVKLPGGFWLEPAYGGGAIVQAVNHLRQDVTWLTNDTQPGAILKLDYTGLSGALLGARSFDVCLTNPPFSLALAFACQALRDAHTVAFLLRLNWLCAKRERHGFLKRHPPSVHVLPERPGFTGNGKSDMQEYAWFVWGAGEPGTWHTLPSMSKYERKHWDAAVCY